VDAAGCQDALTSPVYSYTAQGVPSIEFGIAEMGWWLNGSCNSGGGNGTGGQCAMNATCQDVQTPSGAWGHRCTCADGMSGDAFAAGEGCHYDGATSGECTVLVLSSSIIYSYIVCSRSRHGDCARVIACATEVLSSRAVLVGGAAGPGVTLTRQPRRHESLPCCAQSYAT
jgi:hypothetical protein